MRAGDPPHGGGHGIYHVDRNGVILLMEPKHFDDEDRDFLPEHQYVVLAKNQKPKYRELPVVRFMQGPEYRVISRWSLTPEERARIAAGEDLYLEQLTFGNLFQPILPTVGLRDFCPKDT